MNALIIQCQLKIFIQGFSGTTMNVTEEEEARLLMVSHLSLVKYFN